MQTTVEILLAAWNGAPFIRAQIDSILAQSETRWHLTVSDDGSTDETPQILKEYAAAHPDKISVYSSGKRFGNARDHFFHLMNVCPAAYMMFCDQDDVWHADKVEKTLKALLDGEKKHGKDMPLLVFTDLRPVDAVLHPLAPSLMQYQKQYTDVIDYRALLLQNVITGCTVGINRALKEKAALCRDCAQTLMHDWWLGLTAARFGKAIFLNEATIDYRQHGRNSVGAQDVSSLKHILGRLSHLKALRKTIVDKKLQAKVFLNTYQEALTPQDTAFLTAFARSHTGPFFYFRHRALIHGFFRLAGLMVLG